MAKIFSILTLLAAAAAIFFGFKGKELVDKLQVAAEREHTDLLATKDKLKKTEKERDETKAELASTKDELEKTRESLVKTTDELKKTMGELAAAMAETEKAKADYVAVKENFDKLKALFGDKNPEDILKSITAMEAANKEMTAKVAEADIKLTERGEVIKGLEAKVKSVEAQFADKEKTIKRYRENVMEKGTRGRVLAVNSGWGFCVISIGDRKGAAANKVLIVARNGQAIGKVKITNIEASQAVADILPSTFVRGTYVEPGDEVIFTGDDKVREEIAAPAPAVGPVTSPLGVPGLPER